mmetsp:Transcript_16574/g.20264  ORF Transcript_16574/g.20264 Transcript_16574/m.20264 type:complete len:103 (+) Transcript_16574:74-382(+)
MGGFKILLQEQNKDVARKLGVATGCMFTMPFVVYFLSYSYVFTSKANPESWSGVMAVLAANVVIFGYVWSAFQEPDDFPDARLQDKNDELFPKVGAFKQRTD